MRAPNFACLPRAARCRSHRARGRARHPPAGGRGRHSRARRSRHRGGRPRTSTCRLRPWPLPDRPPSVSRRRGHRPPEPPPRESSRPCAAAPGNREGSFPSSALGFPARSGRPGCPNHAPGSRSAEPRAAANARLSRTRSLSACFSTSSISAILYSAIVISVLGSRSCNPNLPEDRR